MKIILQKERMIGRKRKREERGNRKEGGIGEHLNDWGRLGVLFFIFNGIDPVKDPKLMFRHLP